MSSLNATGKTQGLPVSEPRHHEESWRAQYWRKLGAGERVQKKERSPQLVNRQMQMFGCKGRTEENLWGSKHSSVSVVGKRNRIIPRCEVVSSNCLLSSEDKAALYETSGRSPWVTTELIWQGTLSSSSNTQSPDPGLNRINKPLQ